MSQAPNPFTQVASQGYGDYGATIDDEEDEQEDNHIADEEEQELEGPQSPEPEVNELGFTQTQERSYPVGIESPDEDENEGQENGSDNEDQAGPSSPPQDEDSNEQQQDNVEDDEDDDTHKKQSRRRVQIMNDSDNEEESEAKPTSSVSKEKKSHFLKQFTMKNEDSHKKHKKRHSDEHRSRHEEKSKRFRKSSNDEDNEEQQDDNVEATSEVEDVVDDIFGKDTNEDEEEADDQQEIAEELADLNDNEAVQEEENDDEADAEQQETFDTGEDGDEDQSARKATFPKSKTVIDYDVDLYLEKRAEQRRGRRSRGKGDSDSTDPHGDQLVGKLIDKMKIATEEDRIFNKSRQPATAKLLLLPIVEQHLCRTDLTEIFLEHGILTVFKDWLSPLPDKSLPNIKIRESIIKHLQQFGGINTDSLRDSGIGKALMYLYKHPRETKENKIKLIKIIHEWARPIFQLETDYKLLTRDDREKRDVAQATLKRQTSTTAKTKNRNVDVDLPFAANKQQDDDELNEDDCPRARVPRPSNKDYVKRPVSTVEYSDKKDGSKKKTKTRFDEIKQQQQYRKRNSKPMSIVKLSIEGNKMHL